MAECKDYVLESDRDVWIFDEGKTISLHNKGEIKTYDVAIVKRFGVLTSAAIESRDKDAKVHYFARHNDKLIFDSIAFIPECELED